MPALKVQAFYDQLGFTPIPTEEIDALLRKHRSDERVRRYLSTSDLHGQRGDDVSNRAFYQCFYGECVPELNIPWAEAYARSYDLPHELAVLPKLALFCDHPERRTRVIDLGCGMGLPLCYLAVQFPETSFVGVDRSAEGLALAQRYVARLGLKNVTVRQHDAFQLAGVFSDHERFDGAILRNVLDDVREAWTPFAAARFDTTRRLTALRSILTPNARVWVSLTAEPPEERRTCEARVRQDLAAAGYAVFPALDILYLMDGRERVHLWWTICPRPEEVSPPTAVPHRPGYVPAYHYPKGSGIPVEDAVLAEQCYLNLDNPSRCPRCGTEGAGVIYQDGPARTRVNHYKVWVRVYACANPACEHGYPTAEVLD